MAKRFTDTDKWKKAWFRTLDMKHKIAWLFLCDNCDHAGIWDVDMDLFQFQSGVKMTLEELVDGFQGKVRLFDDNTKLWLLPFFEFQYSSSKEGFKAKLSAISILQKHGLIDDQGNITIRVTQDLGKSTPTLGEQSPDCPSISIGIGISKKGGVGENKKAIPTKGPIPEFADNEIIAAHLVNVSHEVQQLWIETYKNVPAIKQEILKAITWTKVKKKHRPKFGAFISNWLSDKDFSDALPDQLSVGGSSSKKLSPELEAEFAEQDRMRREWGLS